MARKEKKSRKREEAEGAEKKGRKKLLLIPLVLILAAAAVFVAVRFVLPKLGGGEETKNPKKGVLESYGQHPGGGGRGSHCQPRPGEDYGGL